ncbi:uncharacterized protein LOC135826486 [Sycon ciliatum]|uniref:uncharacterized protein LOC135826486 n=1 Tax=Sycon ciliatum TaxID=27933 RepID=UPI0031F70B95
MESCRRSLVDCRAEGHFIRTRERPTVVMACAHVSTPDSAAWSPRHESAEFSSSGSEEEEDESIELTMRKTRQRLLRSQQTSSLAPFKPNSSSLVLGGTRKKMREFLGVLLDLDEVEGLSWLDKATKTFRMPWRHATKKGNGYSAERDTKLTMLWALNTQKYNPDTQPAEPSRWKTNFRCALNSLKHSIVEVENHEHTRGYKIYRFVDSRRGRGRGCQLGGTRGSPPGGVVGHSGTIPGDVTLVEDSADRTMATTPLSPSQHKHHRQIQSHAAAQRSHANAAAIPSHRSSIAESTSALTPTTAATTPRSTIKDMLPGESRSLSTASIFTMASDLSATMPTPDTSDSFPQLLDDFNDGDFAWGEHGSGILTPQDSALQLNSDFLSDMSPPSFDGTSTTTADTLTAPAGMDPMLSLPSMMSSYTAPLTTSGQTTATDDYHTFNDTFQSQHAFQRNPVATPAPGVTSTQQQQQRKHNTDKDLYVSINYRQNTVAGCEVGVHGCRLFSGALPHLHQRLSHDEYTRLYGGCKMQQLALPSPMTSQRCLQSLQLLLGDGGKPGLMARGLCIEVENDNIYATRLCRPQVFWGCSQNCNGASLPRGERTCIFDFKLFKNVLESYRQNTRLSASIASQPPPHHVQLGIGQPWGTHVQRLPMNNLLTASITHLKAERLIEQLHADKWLAGQPLNTDHLIVDEPMQDDDLAQSLFTLP